MRTDIVESLQAVSGNGGGNHFMVNRERATDARVRQLRPKGKRREHIYLWERDAAADLWTALVFVNAEDRQLVLAKYDNKDKILSINTKHHPILVKVLTSVIANDWPEVSIKTFEGRAEPVYSWRQREPEPRPEPQMYEAPESDGRPLRHHEWLSTSGASYFYNEIDSRITGGN
jgi:hypothetical protein